MKYTVANFQWIDGETEKGVKVRTRDYFIVSKNLDWQDAKKTRNENKGSWIYRQ